MAAAPRHVYGPRPVGALVPGLTRAAFTPPRTRLCTAQVLADWSSIVGPGAGGGYACLGGLARAR